MIEMNKKQIFKIWLGCQWGIMIFTGCSVMLTSYFVLSLIVPHTTLEDLKNMILIQLTYFVVSLTVLFFLTDYIQKKYNFEYGMDLK
jgi:hypothetical protein